jgi:hypothetical protein
MENQIMLKDKYDHSKHRYLILDGIPDIEASTSRIPRYKKLLVKPNPNLHSRWNAHPINAEIELEVGNLALQRFGTGQAGFLINEIGVNKHGPYIKGCRQHAINGPIYKRWWADNKMLETSILDVIQPIPMCVEERLHTCEEGMTQSSIDYLKGKTDA